MQNPLYFSDKFQLVADKLKFCTTILVRLVKILFKRTKILEVKQLDYSSKYLFDKSLIVISYKFKNALWHDFKNLKKTLEDKTVVFNLNKIPTNNITLIVYGFFQKKIYHINLIPEKTLEVKTFKVSASGFDRKIAFNSPIKLERKNASLSLPKIYLAKTKIAINHSSYHQNDFL